MDNKKRDLLIKLLSSFLILLSCCLGVALLINLRFQQDCATVIVGMLGVCATLYAPVAAFFLYDSWKDQKNYELKKGLIEKIIESVSATQYSMLRRMRYAKGLTEINEKLIIFNNVKSITSVGDELSYHILAYSNIAIYEKLAADEEIRQEYRWYESYCMQLNSFHKQIANIYQNYYEKIDKDLLNDLGEDTIRSKFYDQHDEKIIFNYEVFEMERLMKVKDPIKYSGKVPIEYSKTYNDLIEAFEKKSDDLITLLVEKIKI